MKSSRSQKSFRSENSVRSGRSVRSRKSARDSVTSIRTVREAEQPEETVIAKQEGLLDINYADNVITFLIPQDEQLQICRKTYETSPETAALFSEKGRETHAETFILDTQLGALSDLAARSLAINYGADPMPIVKEDYLLERSHYDALDPDLPLEQCYFVPDQCFWKKYVTTKDSRLGCETNYNWRRHGISLKFVEKMESCLPEYWNEEEMEALALKIKDYVFAMHIEHLQGLQVRSFDTLLEDEELEDLYAASSSSQASLTDRPAVAALPEPDNESTYISETASVMKSLSLEGSEEESEMLSKNESEFDLEQELYESEMRRKLLEETILADRNRRKSLRMSLIPKPPPPPPPEPEVVGKKKKKKKKKIEGALDISVDESPPRLYDLQDDKRNVNACLYKLKRYNFPAYDCHHINLDILRFFQNLATLTIEFHGPEHGAEYHPRHLNFSYTDILNLASGVRRLQNLIIFRLRNSRMDAMKLEIMVDGLLELPKLETVDFGYDQLKDDCALIIKRLVRVAPQLKHLELEGNKIGSRVLTKLAEALYRNNGKLEYLGLAQNSFKDEGFDKLARAIADTKQVNELCLSGTILSQAAITNYVANTLIRNNDVLERLDLGGIPMDPSTAIDVYNALQTNHRITSLDCRGCDFDFELDADFEMLLRRNRYIAENPYIGDETQTKEAIEEFVNRTKHPVLVDALAKLEKRKNCYKNMPNAYLELVKSEQPAVEEVILPYFDSDDYVIPGDEEEAEEEEEEEEEGEKPEKPFVYDPLSFNEEQFKVHAISAGPSDRYFYLLNKGAISTECNLQYK